MTVDRAADGNDRGWVVVGWPMFSALVGSMVIEVPGVTVEHRDGMSLPVDQDPVGALLADRAHESFSVSVRGGLT